MTRRTEPPCWPTFLSLAGSLAFAATAVAASAPNQNWPQWRGPLQTGVAPEANPPVTWSETNNVKWKVKIPGSGYVGVATGGVTLSGTLATPMSWTGGTLYGQLNIAANGLLAASGAGTRYLQAAVTNWGTITLASPLQFNATGMLVANQDSNLISVFARDPATGELADEVKSSVAVEAPMRILFV